MLVVAILGLPARLPARARPAALRCASSAPACCSGLVALTVYLPGVLTASSTARATEYGTGFGGKFTTDPLALLASVLPDGAVPSTPTRLLPVRLPGLAPPGAAVARLGAGAPRAGGRSAGCWLFIDRDGCARRRPDPDRAAAVAAAPPAVPACVALVVLLVVAWPGSASRGRRDVRLALSLAWVVAGRSAGAAPRSPSQWRAHLCAVALVAGALALLWWLLRTGRRSWLAPVAGVVTLAALAVQHGFFPTPPSPQRHAPTDLSAYQGLLPGRGRRRAPGRRHRQHGPVERSPAAQELPIGSAWYLTGLHGPEHLHRDQPRGVQGPLLRLLPGQHVPRAARHGCSPWSRPPAGSGSTCSG